MQNLRLLLYPFSILYNGVTSLRNYAFDKGVLEQHEFEIPIIAVGNLSTGGTGKTPMIEYFIKKNKGLKIGVLSRGYGRKTSGYIEIDLNDTVHKVGDEPLQIKLKFKDLIVSAVCEKRVDGIHNLLNNHDLDLILLDDAYQHRHVKASHYVLLTSYGNLYKDDYLLPAGNLRESRSGANRAQTVVVTKCPASISVDEALIIKQKLQLLPSQQLCFSYIAYDDFVYGATARKNLNDFKGREVTVVTGIANPVPFIKYLKKFITVDHLKYTDHHNFTNEEVEVIRSKEIVITTEKDYVRLKNLDLPNVMYLPIQTKFIGEEPSL
ncbi:tetraacyldisaccharide 4'-kinase [uncultured Nonlabens sp.]|uniref:tetraacyldisaccharide 4'-kinase n=1 Tax=uncultured Nonlabens sp. TaxID=859306 RepID=UPI002636ABA0|nr:tetraacyldisaccharide 4'-kinase [uncultured Nonlabens sp.]